MSPAARSAPPNRARTGNPPLRTRELAGARTVSGHEHQGDEAKPRLDPGEESKTRHLRGPGRSALPGPPARNYGCLPEPVKSASGVLRIGYAATWQNPSDQVMSKRNDALANRCRRGYGSFVQMPWKARIYERTCVDCGFVWRVPKAVARPRMRSMPASGRRAGASAIAAVIAANAALSERAAVFRLCSRCESVQYKQTSVRS
jgi:hypothetical protein